MFLFHKLYNVYFMYVYKLQNLYLEYRVTEQKYWILQKKKTQTTVLLKKLNYFFFTFYYFKYSK